MRCVNLQGTSIENDIESVDLFVLMDYIFSMV